MTRILASELAKVELSPTVLAEATQGLKLETLSLEEIAKLLQYHGLAQDIRHRKYFGIATYGLVCVWLIASMTLLYFVAFQLAGAKLTDTVLVAMLSSTTATVVGLLWLVLAYLFPGDKKSP